MVAAIVLPTALGLMLALLLGLKVPGARVFKTIFYLPICLSAVIVGQIWIWIYQPDWGLLNTVIAQT
jgi:ABC-type sugar transport system permease subunit